MKKLTCTLLAALLLLTLTACGTAAESAPVNMQELYDSMADKLPEMLPLDADMMMSFCGIDAADCNQAVAAIAAEGMAVDEVWLVEAVDEAAADKIQALADTRLRMKGEETESYAPDLYEIVKKGRLVRNGTYLALIVTPEAEALSQTVTEVFGN